jgi:gamma-glutamylputrescine oxidase
MGTAVAGARKWGEPLWKTGVSVAPSPLPRRVEVAVIGAGFAGLSGAVALAAGGARVHVFEAGRLGDGASGRSGGIALEGTAFGALERVEHCLATLSDVVRAHGIACELELGGCMEVRHRASSDAPAGGPSWPDEAAGRLVPDRTVPGGTVAPGLLLAGLARAALRAGVVVREHTRIEHCEPGRPHRLRAEGRSIEADRVLLAVDALPPSLLPVPGVRPALTLAVATRPLAAGVVADVALGGTPFYTTDLPYLSGRATRDGRLVMGAGLVFDPAGDLERVSVSSPEGTDAFARIERRIRGLHPALEQVEITHRWGGPIAFRERAPALAEPAPGLVVSGAYAGHGVALSLRVGALAAERLLGGDDLPRWGI